MIDLILNNNHLQTAASHWNRRLLSTAVRKMRRIRTKPKYISVYLAVFMLLFTYTEYFLMGERVLEQHISDVCSPEIRVILTEIQNQGRRAFRWNGTWDSRYFWLV